jgi:hypothetical protein
MNCFNRIHKQEEQPISSPQIEKDQIESHNQELYELFKHSIDYAAFHSKVLMHKNLFYNNYDCDAFAQLKEHDGSLLDNCKTDDDKELKTSMAVYDAIVDLYVCRFLKQYPELNNEECLSSLRTIALGIAIKISWDEAIDNIDYSSFITPYMGANLHKKMELEFLAAIDWNTSTDELRIDYKDRNVEEDISKTNTGQVIRGRLQ